MNVASLSQALAVISDIACRETLYLVSPPADGTLQGTGTECGTVTFACRFDGPVAPHGVTSFRAVFDGPAAAYDPGLVRAWAWQQPTRPSAFYFVQVARQPARLLVTGDVPAGRGTVFGPFPSWGDAEAVAAYIRPALHTPAGGRSVWDQALRRAAEGLLAPVRFPHAPADLARCSAGQRLRQARRALARGLVVLARYQLAGVADQLVAAGQPALAATARRLAACDEPAAPAVWELVARVQVLACGSPACPAAAGVA